MRTSTSYYVTAPNSRTVIGVYGSALYEMARDSAKDKEGALFKHVGERACCGQELPKGSKPVKI